MNYNLDEIKEREPAKQKERDTITDMLRKIDDEKYLRRIRFYVSGFVGQDSQ